MSLMSIEFWAKTVNSSRYLSKVDATVLIKSSILSSLKY